MVVFLHRLPPSCVVLFLRRGSDADHRAISRMSWVCPMMGRRDLREQILFAGGLGLAPTSSAQRGIWQTIREDCMYKCVARRSSVKSVCLIDPSRAIQRESPVPCLPPPAPGLPVVDEIGVADDGNRVACRVNQAVSLQRFQPAFHHCGVHARQTGDHLRVVWNAVRDE